MANIKQQKKRVGIAQRQRLENLRYKSTVKTLFRNLQDQVNLGDKDAASTVHRELVRLLDRAAARKSMHPNTAARKKSRASRLLISEPVKETKIVRKSRKKAVARKPKAEGATTTATETKTAATKAPAKSATTKTPATKSATTKATAAKAPAKASTTKATTAKVTTAEATTTEPETSDAVAAEVPVDAAAADAPIEASVSEEAAPSAEGDKE